MPQHSFGTRACRVSHVKDETYKKEVKMALSVLHLIPLF